jgi:hypothetical protein
MFWTSKRGLSLCLIRKCEGKFLCLAEKEQYLFLIHFNSVCHCPEVCDAWQPFGVFSQGNCWLQFQS